MILTSTVFWLIHPCDWQTDRRMDGRICAIARKNGFYCISNQKSVVKCQVKMALTAKREYTSSCWHTVEAWSPNFKQCRKLASVRQQDVYRCQVITCWWLLWAKATLRHDASQHWHLLNETQSYDNKNKQIPQQIINIEHRLVWFLVRAVGTVSSATVYRMFGNLVLFHL